MISALVVVWPSLGKTGPGLRRRVVIARATELPGAVADS